MLDQKGASLRPANKKMVEILKNWERKPTIFRLYEGMQLPEDLVLIHERDDYYSLQTAIATDLEDFNAKITKIMQEAAQQTREQFFQLYYNIDDQDS